MDAIDQLLSELRSAGWRLVPDEEHGVKYKIIRHPAKPVPEDLRNRLQANREAVIRRVLGQPDPEPPPEEPQDRGCDLCKASCFGTTRDLRDACDWGFSRGQLGECPFSGGSKRPDGLRELDWLLSDSVANAFDNRPVFVYEMAFRKQLLAIVNDTMKANAKAKKKPSLFDGHSDELREIPDPDPVSLAEAVEIQAKGLESFGNTLGLIQLHVRAVMGDKNEMALPEESHEDDPEPEGSQESNLLEW